MSVVVMRATSDIPLRKAIFYVVECRIDEDACVIPGSRFDPNGFMNQAALRKVFIGDGNRYRHQGYGNTIKNTNSELTVFAHQGYKLAIRAPGDILDRWTVQLCNNLLLLNIIEGNRRRRAQDETRSPTIKYVVGLDWRLDSFYHGVRQIANLDKLTNC